MCLFFDYKCSPFGLDYMCNFILQAYFLDESGFIEQVLERIDNK